MNSSITFAVITVSDSCSAGLATDDSGKVLEELIYKTFKSSDLVFYTIIPDDLELIKNTLINTCDQMEVNVIFTTGGTGFSARDNTPEATKAAIEKEAPQLALAMSLESFKVTKFAALSRAICGIRKKTLIINLPGSKKAVMECFNAISDVIPHAVQLIINDLENVVKHHKKLVQNMMSLSQSLLTTTTTTMPNGKQEFHHVCPHKTATGTDPSDRNSKYPMIDVNLAQKMIMDVLPITSYLNHNAIANMDLPPFRASIKDGYAIKCAGGKDVREVIGTINAGDEIIVDDFLPYECFKINTGAPVPENADCIIQIEDTKLLSIDGDDGKEKEIEILIQPHLNLDIRPIGSDLNANDLLFGDESHELNPGNVASASIFSSIGQLPPRPKIDLIIGIISTGDELIAPGNHLKSGQIYDSNTTILRELLKQFGYTNVKCFIAKDSRESLKNIIQSKLSDANIIICSGGVSMGDKDFVKSILTELQFKIHFGRVNMKPGKPMTFASNSTNNKYFFGLPGNPVSTFVTFHLFVLPALRKLNCYSLEKCYLPIIKVRLEENQRFPLDPRPEYARAKIISKNGVLYASVLGNQISSRLQSIIGADVLLHLPAQSPDTQFITADTLLDASVLKFDFISQYS